MLRKKNKAYKTSGIFIVFNRRVTKGLSENVTWRNSLKVGRKMWIFGVS